MKAKRSVFLSIVALLGALVITGCAKAPLNLKIVDYETGQPLDSARVFAFYPSMFELFVPRIEEASTDPNGNATIRIARFKDRQLHLNITQRSTSGEWYSGDISLEPGFLNSVLTHYEDHRDALELVIPLPIQRRFAQAFEFKIPDGYRGPVGIAWIQDSSTWNEFVGVAEFRILIDNQITLLESRKINDPTTYPQLKLVFDSGEPIGRLDHGLPPDAIVGQSIISHANRELNPSRGVLAEGARLELSGSRGELIWIGTVEEWEQGLGDLVDPEVRLRALRLLAPVEGASQTSTLSLTHTPR